MSEAGADDSLIKSRQGIKNGSAGAVMILAEKLRDIDRIRSARQMRGACPYERGGERKTGAGAY